MMFMHQDHNRGFKFDLICALVDDGFTYRDATFILNSIFQTLIDALNRHESVEVEGFGTWSVVPVKSPRAWRFGKVITQKPYRVSFGFTGSFDQYRVLSSPTPGGTSIAARMPANHENSRNAGLSRYIAAIRGFLLNELYTEDHRQFWVLRWHSIWFHGAFAAAQENRTTSYGIDLVQHAIDRTRVESIASGGHTRTIDLVCWYARWSAAIEVDADLWNEPERIVSRQFR
jgi:nucleoid DNA-binding protein